MSKRLCLNCNNPTPQPSKGKGGNGGGALTYCNIACRTAYRKRMVNNKAVEAVGLSIQEIEYRKALFLGVKGGDQKAKDRLWKEFRIKFIQ